MDIKELTQAEEEVLDLLTAEYLTQKQIALRRKTSIQAVSKIVKKLKQKGAFTKGLVKVEKEGVGIQPSVFSPHPWEMPWRTENQLRIHNQQWDIKILYKSEKSLKLLEKASEIEVDSNKINLWENKPDIYSNQSIYGDDV